MVGVFDSKICDNTVKNCGSSPNEDKLNHYVFDSLSGWKVSVSIVAEECKSKNCEVGLNVMKNGEVRKMTRYVHEFHTSCITEANAYA